MKDLVAPHASLALGAGPCDEARSQGWLTSGTWRSPVTR
jgi:hypothetical protein